MSLAKTLASVLLPVGLVILLLAGALWSLHRGALRGTRMILIVAIALLWVGGTPATAEWLVAVLEARHPPVAEADVPASQAIVVLGGGVARVDPTGGAVPGPEAGRAWGTLRLFEAGRAPLIVVSGGGEIPEASLIGELLGEWSVPTQALVLEPASRSTRENALATRDILNVRGIDRILLVTTALHMPRAAAAFRVAGLVVTPFPVGFRSMDNQASSPIARWGPTAEALADTTAALLELAAGLYYRLRGWG